MRVRPFRAVAMVLIVGAAACGETPVAPDATAGEVLPTYLTMAGQRTAAGRAGGFLCYTSVRTPDGPHRYRYGQMELDFPRRALAADGSTVQYRFRVQREGEEPSVVANCRIPATADAIRITHRQFRVDKRARITERRRGAGEGEMTTQGCVGGGMCELEAIEVVVEGCSNPDWTRGEDGVCRSDRGGSGGSGGTGGWGGGDWGGGGGSDPDPGTPPEPCNTGSPVIDSQEVQEGFDQAMQQSNPTAPLNERSEQYGWIVKTATGFRLHLVGAGSFCGYNGEIPYPPEGPGAIVALFHTHPYTRDEPILTCGENGSISGSALYEGIPSDFDRQTAAQLGVPGVIIDADQIIVFDGENGSGDATTPRCGY